MCYAYSSPSERDYSLEEIELRLDQLIAVEGKGISLQISGGEPSVRKDLDNIAAMVKSKGFWSIKNGQQWYPPGTRTRFRRKACLISQYPLHVVSAHTL